MDLIQFQNNCQTYDAWKILYPIINKHLDLIVKLNKDQLRRGETAEGYATPSHSKSPMSEIYVDSKIERGVYDESIYPRMNFYNTGDFYKWFKAKVTLLDIEIDSFDSKTKEIESKYGNDLLGLTDQSIGILVDNIIDEFQEDSFNYLAKEN
jgi:hypothetical protein